MKIGIQHTPGTFSERWIKYCKENKIQYKLVDCYSNDIIVQLEDCNALMWHHQQINYKDLLFAKQLISSVEHCGKKVFPDYKTCWHFDDKVGQKYLFEAIEAPFVPTYVFYSENTALDWIKKTTFPKVFKLRSGAGSSNVKLIKSKSQARKIVRKAFGKGFSRFDRIEYLKEKLRRFSDGTESIIGIFKGIGRIFIPPEYANMFANEKGYVYFQDFIPNNSYDIRVVVIGEKAFAIKRMVRKNDFRASGSGNILYEKENIPIETIKLSLQIAEKLQTQCIAFDFVYDILKDPQVVEMSFGFSPDPYDKCDGFWDKTLHYHKGPFTPQDWIIQSLIKSSTEL